MLWEVDGQSQRVWSRDPDAAVSTTGPATPVAIKFVFDRRLDGARVEDTVNGNPVSKANPPITVGWPDMAATMSDPPFAADVFYNSLPNFGPSTTYAFVLPRIPGFPSATPITFALDPNGLTSIYGEPMDRTDVDHRDHRALTVTLPNTSATVPTSYLAAITFSTRAPAGPALAPFINVASAGVGLPFALAPRRRRSEAGLHRPRRLPGRLAAGGAGRHQRGRRLARRLRPPARRRRHGSFRRPPPHRAHHRPTAAAPRRRRRAATRRLRQRRRSSARRRGAKTRTRGRAVAPPRRKPLGELRANTSAKASRTPRLTAAISTGRPSSPDIEPITAASSPQGLMAAKRARSVATLSAKPCSVTQRSTATPIDASLRSRRVPDAGPSRLARRLDAEARQRADERLLEVAQIDVQVALVVAQQEDRVADELPGAVVGDVAAALDLEERRVAEVEQVARAWALRPGVITCGCSTSSSVSGISSRWRSATSSSCSAQTSP